MRKTFWGMALEMLKANRLLILFTIISILVSTLLITTMLAYSLNAQRAMEQSFREMFGEADIMISYPPEHPDVLSKEKADRIVSLPGIEESAHVLSGFLHFGEANMPVWTIGTTSNNLTKSTYKFTSEIAPSMIILNEGLAKFMKVGIDDHVVVEGMTFRVSEINEDPQGLVNLSVIHYDHMIPFAKEGEYASGLMLKLAKGVDALSVVQKIREIDDNLRIDLVEQNELVQSNIRTLHTYTIVLSFLILVVTTLLILSNLEILLYKLRNQIAILRSIGASTAQIGRIVLIQSFVINLTGTILGGGVSVLATNGLFRVAERVFRMPETAEHTSGFPVVPIIAAACFLFFQLFMLMPAYRSMRILPQEIMEENERLDFKHKKKHKRRGWIVVLTGGAVYFFGYVNENYVLLFPGMLILLIGSLLLMPHVIEKLIHGVLKVVGRRLGRLVYLTFKNMLPQVRRNAFAVISVSLTLAIVVFGTTLLHTLDANNLRFLKENYEKPIMLYNRLGSESTLDHQWLHDTLLAFDSIREVQYEGVLLLNYLMLSDENVRITPLAVYSPLVEGLKDDELVISKDLADQYHLQAGDEIVIGSFDAVTQDIVPVGVYRIGRISGELKQPDYALMTWYNPLNLSPTVSRIFIDPNDEAQALADLESVRAQFPELQVTTLNEAMEQAREGFIQRWGIFIVVLSVIIGCSMAGVLNGLMNQILSKRKEFAVLRTIGVSPAGILCNILVQVGLYVGLGIICGGLLGFLIFALVLAMDPAPVTFDFATIGLIGAGMLLLAVATFAIAGRHLSSGNIRREMAMDGT